MEAIGGRLNMIPRAQSYREALKEKRLRGDAV